ncbi:helix-turn-helix domain-containing protein [Priestia taiwanensis]|uniref:ATP-dependent DNA helicase RecQ n=1 Tax=Priestia taiwanensis TaxID=1347902 RepID=A0A917EK51_9BACI|nr:helix-turn-helix domain-containing protein [Priestia taiwanensis]MBM7361634.1 uncharacterized protein YpbB [Priestia taiwanensis]GGE55709.1 ATP-dependent DNA helicase RecQ [Priestia taiwanensis]
MNELHFLLMKMMKQIAGDRTIYGLYHLLKGKKSSQTIQDASMYGLLPYFRIIPSLTRPVFDEHITYLRQRGYIKAKENSVYELTDSGLAHLLEQEKIAPLPTKMNGYKYSDVAMTFWRRLSLLVQTISHMKQGSKTFQPIIQDEETTKWVKQFLLHSGYMRDELAEKVHEECYRFLVTRSEEEATIFVLRLTGHDRIGWTNEQIGRKLGMHSWRVYFIAQQLLHEWIRIIRQRGEYALLAYICPAEETMLLSHSTKTTYELLQKGFSIDDISKRRGLKRNTIEDHIIEIALYDRQLNIELFLSKEKYKRIEGAYHTYKTRKLRQLKEALEDDISYFEIRLVLARIGKK